MMGRSKGHDHTGAECETFDIAGSTGNCYSTRIGRVPNCDCIDFVSRQSQVSC